MTFHLFGNILTNYGTAANNRGENEGNITTLQKLLWKGEIHTTVSAEAIRWALRYYWQTNDTDHTIVNRQWIEEKNDHDWQDLNFNPQQFIDDDVLGFMRAEGAKEEANDTPKKSGKKSPPKGTATIKRGVLEVTRAVSTTPFNGDITFNSKSGSKDNTSLYGTEIHATRYQYGFALTPNRLEKIERIIPVLDGLISLGEVGGNHARFLYDFSPASIILRWTHDFAPRILYSFEEDENGLICVPDLITRIENQDINPQELWIAGEIAKTDDGDILAQHGVNVLGGIKNLVSLLKKRIATDLDLSFEELV